MLTRLQTPNSQERKMTMEKEEKKKYFEEALSDFVHDVASGRAIRHLVNSGYTTDQIMRQLDFPTPRERVEQTVYRCMTENGTLLEALPVPEKSMETIFLKNAKPAQLAALLSEYLSADGETVSWGLHIEDGKPALHG